jgi:hypothetical protein
MQLHKFSLRLSSAALLLLTATSPLAAAETAPSSSGSTTISGPQADAPAHAKAAPEEPKKICRTIETTSSRLRSKKVCMTREQWRRASYN